MADTEQAPTTLGRYQVAEELGRGAMGIVYLAVDPVIARPVAIKVIKESEHMTPAEVEQFHARFRHEAEAAGRLSHSDIVQVYDIGSNYMVMEYIEGQPLSTLMRGGATWKVREILALVQRAADAIDYAHKNGIVHRDIKPGNIMMMTDGAIKVMDFGVARLDNSNLTAAGTVVGSVRYMAPEQMMGEKVDGRADIFSLAAVAYELLTAHPPFPGKTITEVVSRVVRGGHIPPCEVERRLPKAINKVFAKAFSTKAAERHGRATDFAKDLAEALKTAREIVIAHGVQVETPTEIDATKVEGDVSRPDTGDDTIGTEVTAPMKAAVMAASADATVLMGSAPTPAPTVTTPAAAPTGRVTPAAAKTLIMDLPATHAAGVVTLESDPPNALVFVDGKQVGATPLPDHDVSFGPHEIRLEAPGCEPAVIALDVSREAPLRALTVSLAPEKPKDGTIHAGQFMPFGPDVVPPCRVSGELPVYPEEARRRGLAGSASVEVWVGEKGEVIDLAVVESAGATLDGALLDAVSHWRFTPARVRGVPVSVRLRVQHYFRG